MLLVKASLKPSAIHGLGCFTEEHITKGQLVWVYDERIDVRIRESELPNLPEPVQEFLHYYGYMEMFEGERIIVLCGDHSKHMNHADEPNLLDAGQQNFAARDIEIGEELTCDYYWFDLDVGSKLGSAAPR